MDSESVGLPAKTVRMNPKSVRVDSPTVGVNPKTVGVMARCGNLHFKTVRVFPELVGLHRKTVGRHGKPVRRVARPLQKIVGQASRLSCGLVYPEQLDRLEACPTALRHCCKFSVAKAVAGRGDRFRANQNGGQLALPAA
jgi:hypothetical protein